MASTKYQPPNRAPLPDDYDNFIESLNPRERELLDLATEKLGSSFIVQWCHMYQNWKKSQPAPVPTPVDSSALAATTNTIPIK